MTPDVNMIPAEFDFHPDLATSGGMFDNVDATLTDIRITSEPPPKYTTDGKMPLFCIVTLTLADGAVETQHYSMGGTSSDFFIPDPTGYSIVRNPDVAGSAEATLKKATPFMNLLDSMKALGVPATCFKPSLKQLVGLQGHWSRKLFKIEGMPERAPGAAAAAAAGGQRKLDPIGTLIFSRLDALPGQKAKGVGVVKTGAAAAKTGAAAAAKPAATAATPAATSTPAANTAAVSFDGVDISDGATFLASLLGANNGSVPIAAITKSLFTAIKGPTAVDVRNQVKAILADPERLTNEVGATNDGENLTA